MRLRLQSKQGLTLLEIIVALAILSILLVSFLSLFSNGFTTIITAGNKSRASIEAQEIMDRIYAEANFTTKTELRDSISSIISQIEAGDIVDFSDDVVNFDSLNTTNTKVRFYVSEPQAMLIQNNVYLISLQVYYQNYKRHVTISSPIVR